MTSERGPTLLSTIFTTLQSRGPGFVISCLRNDDKSSIKEEEVVSNLLIKYMTFQRVNLPETVNRIWAVSTLIGLWWFESDTNRLAGPDQLSPVVYDINVDARAINGMPENSARQMHVPRRNRYIRTRLWRGEALSPLSLLHRSTQDSGYNTTHRTLDWGRVVHVF